jgi:hypothetical protein
MGTYAVLGEDGVLVGAQRGHPRLPLFGAGFEGGAHGRRGVCQARQLALACGDERSACSLGARVFLHRNHRVRRRLFQRPRLCGQVRLQLSHRRVAAELDHLQLFRG